jgi:hypothetical protein
MLNATARTICAAALIVIAPAFAVTASAGSLEPGPGYSFIDEVRFGVLAANLEDGDDGGDYTINGEVLFPRLGDRDYGDLLRNYFFRPRVHVGASISPDGVNQVYAGLTWDHHLTDRLFFETSFGAAAHDGETGIDPDSYGCAVQFRESASVGFELTEHWRVMATVDHMSNAGLCDNGNQGLTNAGVRLGYRW